MFKSEKGEWLVHDFAQPLSNGKHTMPLKVYLQKYFDENLQLRVDAIPPQRTTRVGDEQDPYKDAEEALKRLEGRTRPYQGHGLTKCEVPVEDIMTVDRATDGLIPTTAIMIYRDPDGRPWGLQARSTRNGKRSYWWHTKPKLPVSFSKGWRDADILVVAEGVPKAIAMQGLVHRKANSYRRKLAREKGWTSYKEVKVGYIALGGKGSLPKVSEYIAGFPRKVIILLDPDVEQEVKDPKTRDAVAQTVKDIYYGRVGANLRTILLGQPGGDVNDILQRLPAYMVYDQLHEVTPRLNENTATRYMLPAVSDMTTAETALLNAYWQYAIIKGLLRWGKQKGYLADMDPTYAQLMALSGLNHQTIKTTKRKLLQREVLSRNDDGSLRLHVARIRKYFPRKDDGFLKSLTDSSSNSSGANSFLLFLKDNSRSLAVVKLYTPKRRYMDRLGRLAAIGGYRRSRFNDFGSTGVQHILAFLMTRNGGSRAAVGRSLGLDRRTVVAAVRRVWYTLKRMGDAFSEYRRRFMRYAQAMQHRLLMIHRRAAEFVRTRRPELWKYYAALLRIQKRLQRTYKYVTQANINPFAVGLGGVYEN